jgi:4-hydroxy-4-methyl-2-oxoglutarate aldolase
LDFRIDIFLMSRLKPLHHDMKVLGAAFTVNCPEPNLLIISYAINLARPGDVLVIDAKGHRQLSVFGYSMSQSCLNRGIAGVVVDGAVLDSEWLRGETPYAADEEKRRGLLPIWVRAFSPTWADWKKPGSINVPVEIGGVSVRPGDVVCGVQDGVFFPQEKVNEVILGFKEEAKFAKGRKWLTRTKSGETWFDILEMQQRLDRLAIPERALYQDSAS